MTDQLQTQQTAVLAAVDTGAWDVETSLAELRELAQTAGYAVAGALTQKRADPDPAAYLGSGRAEELAAFIQNTNAQLVIADDELSPVQLRNLEKLCDCPVIDRTMLILDIFANRAVTSEGKLQVDLARLRYQLPRLAGRGTQLSRQGGGGGGGAGARRGAGESKLETDRRHIRRRISALEAKLQQLEQRRQRLRERRKKDRLTTVAIVGYTNVGKSTLLNTLTKAGVLAEDKLFATLDPTARALSLPDGRTVMLIDTVGLVRRLPHHLVEAFHSTLEEASSADLILSVCDAVSPDRDEQLAVTAGLLRELGAEKTPVLVVLNKCDLCAGPPDPPEGKSVSISAKTGAGLETLLQAIADALPPSHLRLTLLLPYAAGEIEGRIASQGQVYRRDYQPEGVLLEASVPAGLLREVSPYLAGGDFDDGEVRPCRK